MKNNNIHSEKAEEINMTEVWKDIKGYEGFYQVSDKGRIKGLERTFIDKIGRKQYRKERILKPYTNHNGYLLICLYDSSGDRKRFQVHRLVCKAFHENPKNKPQVNHINEDKLDNRACNLEWVTAKENCNHGTHNIRVAKANSKPVGQYTRDGKLIIVWQSVNEAQRQTGFSAGHICQVANGKRKTAHGYVWKYIEEEKKHSKMSAFYL